MKPLERSGRKLLALYPEASRHVLVNEDTWYHFTYLTKDYSVILTKNMDDIN